MTDGPLNPAEKGGILSQTFFCWLLPFFKYGYRNTLEQPDLYRICSEDDSNSLADRLERNWNKELKAHENHEKKPSLLRALIKTFIRPVAFSGVIVFFEECVFKLLQPIILSFLITYFSPEPKITPTQAYLCALGMALCGAFATILHHPYFFQMSRVGMQVRIATSALVFRKSLRLSNSALGQTTVGKLVNILSSDVNRFDVVMLFLHYVWIGPLQLIVLFIILFNNMGPSCLVGFVILLCLAPLQGWMGKLFSKFRNKTALLTDERVRIMNEIISGMRIIKIHAWEFPFSDLVRESRRKEIAKVMRSTHLRSFNIAFFNSATAIISFSTFTVYALTGHVLTPSIVFLAIPLFNAVRLTVVLFIPYCIMYGSEGLIAVRRIQEFLMMEELKTLKNADSLSSIASDANLPIPEQIGEPLEETEKNDRRKDEERTDTIVSNDVTVAFLPDDDNKEKDQLVEDGPDGLVMKHMNDNREEEEKEKEEKEEERRKSKEGSNRDVDGDDGTPERGEDDNDIILRNLGGSWDAKSGDDKVGFTLKNIDFSLRAGQLVAIIGPVGSGKSSLLMAMMNELPTQTGDVIVSGKIAYTAQQPWVFSGTLRDNILFGKKFDPDKYKEALKVCALKTDIELLPDGDLTLVGDRGITLSGGQRARVSLARAVYHEADAYLLDDPLSAVDTAVGRHLFDKCIKGHLRDKPVVLVTHQLQYLDAADCIVVLKDGEMVACGSFEELQTTGIDFAALLKEHESLKQADVVSRTSSIYSIPGAIATEINPIADDIILEADEKASDRQKETKSVGTVAYMVYVTFFRAGAGILGFMVFALFNVSSQAFMNLTDWWLAQWAFAEETACAELLNRSCIVDTVSPNHTFVDEMDVDRPYYLQNLSIFLGLFILFCFIRTYHVFIIIVNAATVLHNRMFEALIRAPMQFFDTNPIGRILNRFSKDIGLMDELLPTTFADFNAISIQTIGVIIVISIFNPIVLIFTVPLCVAFTLVRRYYLASSRDIKRLEGITRSPVFSHLSASLQGLVTIRAFKVQENFTKQFDLHQNTHTRTWFLFLTSTRWFGIMLDWMSVTFLAIVAFTCIISSDIFELNSSLVGLSLTYCLQLMGAFQWGVRQSAEVENLMTSTERVIEYSHLKPEAPLEKEKEPDADWPKHGIITFEDVSVSYSDDGPLVLKNLRCCIRAEEKVGIVGRTGAGKSSLMAALMRLTEPKGILKIDGVTITEIGLHALRKHISFIPQDPVLFSGTLRKNLDPFNHHTDEDMWNALEEVQLKPVVEENSEKLEMAMSEGGTNFSVGQRQLVCLARAVLHRNKILIVDEATANVDPRTDQLIQLTIRKKFRQCTVLTIAHRLNTIMDSDRVLVLDQGRIIEFDEPYVLLKDEKSLFGSMVVETGKSEAAKLLAVARAGYYERNPSNPYDFDIVGDLNESSA
ncbi:multidrug resistance-associated protein 4 isoform X2 [Strongylocentrotus purpuratus]|uniref:Cystic fibrosis transmembrane conductance regulator n=1 Tax=Strongylocentrotus purpuratus TaxID=7668 RepID=A0A7M7NKP7_STRPU|nr:multidrug resistance-associated protein 4 isoform X2 [Strongylocentrotus purpuratus]|eukprot:XP_011681070.1 PREDICTED: multidrug resistance-associated protein 4 isoform X3 [Strongylocentrotus purpuratus]